MAITTFTTLVSIALKWLSGAITIWIVKSSFTSICAIVDDTAIMFDRVEHGWLNEEIGPFLYWWVISLKSFLLIAFVTIRLPIVVSSSRLFDFKR